MKITGEIDSHVSSMASSPGWRAIEALIDEEIERSRVEMETASTFDAVRMAQGRIAGLRWVRSLPAEVRRAAERPR